MVSVPNALFDALIYELQVLKSERDVALARLEEIESENEKLRNQLARCGWAAAYPSVPPPTPNRDSD